MRAAAAIAAALATAGAADPASRVKWQAHSYNDMREWHQLLRKGAELIKIDPNYRSASFCADQANVADPGDPRGCFVLNHDTPTALWKRDDYNTTDDVLALLGDEDYRGYLTREQTTYFALCFKSQPAGICGNSTAAAASWLSLVDDLVADYSAAVEANGLNVEFVLDSGVPQDCWIQRWRPWVSTSGPDEAFWSNDADLGYDRWQVLNPKVGSTFSSYANDSWGKFVNSSYAFQVWEPEDQQEILDTIQTYVDVGVDHEPGLRFAINQDPAVFDVYAAPLTGNGRHEALAQGASAPLVAVAGEQVVAAWTDTASGAVLLSVDGGAPQPLPSNSSASTTTTAGARLSAVNGSAVLLSTPEGGALLSVPGLELQAELGAFAADAVLVDGTAWLAALEAPASDDCALAVEVRALADGAAVAPAVCLSTGDVAVAVADASVALSAALEGLAVFATGDGEVRGAYVTAGAAGAEFADTALDVGRAPRLALSADGGSVLEVHADGFCQNQETQNKTPRPGVCDAQRRSTAGVLQYNWGSLAAWRAELAAGRLLNACSLDVFHGVYDLGHSPAAALLPSGAAVAVHEAYTAADKDAGKCGPPVAEEEGVVMVDSWGLPLMF